MRIDLDNLERRYDALHASRASDQSAQRRRRPRLTDYDYLALRTLREDVEQLAGQVPGRGTALDIGSGNSPYAAILQAGGFSVKTLDLTPDTGPDYVGSAEATGLEAGSFDAVLCTQVLEHVVDPRAVVREITRLLPVGGHAIVSAPHVWFFHPHPRDHWRFTQPGLVQLVELAGLTPVTLLGQGGSVLALCQIVNFLAYGVLGRLGTPLYVLMNLAARLDRLVANDLFCLNFACLARKDVR